MKKLTRTGPVFKGLTLGLDLHKSFIAFCALDEKGDELESGKCASDHESLQALVDHLEERGDLQVACEACGCFLWVYDLCAEKLGEQNIHVAQPAKLRAIANSHEKNDANDAWWLAYFLYDRRLPEAFVPTDDLRALRVCVREMRACTDDRSDLLRRLKSHFAQLGIKLPQGWHLSNVKRKKVKTLIREQTGVKEIALQRTFIRIMRLSREVHFWEKQAEELQKKFSEIKHMETELPGIGPKISATIFAELGSPKRFHSAKAFAKATGLTPGNRESGGKRKSSAISRAGSAYARWALTRAVVGCMRCKHGPGARVKAWVNWKAKNQKKKKFIVAAARKLAEGIWRLFVLGETFDLTKAFPVPVTELKKGS